MDKTDKNHGKQSDGKMLSDNDRMLNDTSSMAIDIKNMETKK